MIAEWQSPKVEVILATMVTRHFARYLGAAAGVSPI